MVARGSFGARSSFTKAELVCWRCALKSTPRCKPILQQSTNTVPGILRKYVAQTVSQDLLSTDREAPWLDCLSRSAKNRANSTKSSQSSQNINPRKSLPSTVRDPKNTSTLNRLSNIVTRRGSHLPLCRRGNHYATSASRNAVSDVEAMPPVDEKSTLRNYPAARQNIREHLHFWERQTHPPMIRTDPFIVKAIDRHQATYNHLAQGADYIQRVERDEGDEEDEGFSRLADRSSHLLPGDVVGLWRAGHPVLGVFIRRFSRQEQFYTMRGKWVHLDPGESNFVVEKMIHPEELEAIIPYLPQQEVSDAEMCQFHAVGIKVPREAGAEIIQKMLAFHSSADLTIKKNASRLHNIHKIIAHPTTRSHASLPEITMKVLKKESREALGKEMLWAVYAALVRDPYCRLERFHDGQRNTFGIMSRADAISHEKVRDWVRDYQELVVNLSPGLQEITPTQHLRNPIPGFIEKCRAVIHESRKTRDAMHSGTTGPSRLRIEPTGPDRSVWKASPLLTHFDEDESKVLKFLHAWSTTRIILRSSTGPAILRAIGMYEVFELGQSTGFLLLKELGIIPPWLGRQHHLTEYPLPHHGVDHLADELHFQAEKSVVGFQMEDSMKDLRRDWGDLEVFCIDDSDACEIDDGLSLEKIDECTFWVHIHIANPSAFLVPSSAIARNAAYKTATVYLADGTYPMLPEEITLPYFSLGNNRPCITFSGKITLAGDVVDTQISHGILRNVSYFTPEDLQRELLPEQESEVQTEDLQRELRLEQESEVQSINTSVGGRMPVMPAIHKTTPMTSSQRGTLRRLCELSQARAQKKAQEGAVSFPDQFKCDPQVHLGPKMKVRARYHLRERTAHRYDGDPIISLHHFLRSSSLNQTTDRMVGRLMVLAGEIGAMWCSKRNIPIPYRGSCPPPTQLESPERFKQKYLDPLTAKQGELPLDMVRRYVSLLGQVVCSVVPLRHSLLSAEAYSKVTSPLRRFQDLMTHWQIEAAIRHESRTGKSLIGNTDDSCLEISRAEAEQLIPRLRAREKAIWKTQKLSKQHWTQQWLFRAFYYKEAPLPELFNLVITDEFSKGYHLGVTRELLIEFKLRENAATKREGGIRIRDVWEVKIEKIDCYYSCCEAEAIRLVERSDIPTEP
ncbi:hypothetical protein MMC29_007304 [Sticta canariensis]|nr:hypothetical protein [Sticta canariensis]